MALIPSGTIAPKRTKKESHSPAATGTGRGGITSDLVVLEYGSELFAENTGSDESCTFVHRATTNEKHVFYTLLKLLWGQRVPLGSLLRFRGVKQKLQA